MSALTPTLAFQRLSWTDTMLGMPTGHPVRSAISSGRNARRVLEDMLRPALGSGRPCYVLFSGGRDSSALLALAVHVARRDGLPEPLPVTARHPEAPESDESSWQEMVIAHLGITEHRIVEMRGEQGLLSETAVSAMRRRGPVWPAAIQSQGALYRHLEPGVVVSGEGGDMVLDGHRTAAVRAALASPGRASLRGAVSALQPRPVARRLLARQLKARDRAIPAWLRGPAHYAYIDAVVDMSQVPFWWDQATRLMTRTRAGVVALANFSMGIIEHGSAPLNPLFESEFADTLANDGGRTGWGDRTAVFRRLVGDLLPDAVVSRTSKASFNSTRWGETERAFAQDWDGGSFDPDWIEAEALRREWLSERPHPASAYLLQVAWALSQGIPVTDGAA